MTLTTHYPRLPDHHENLRERISGKVVTPGDHDYDTGRAAWNLNAEHRPALVVYAEDAADVSEAVRFARRAGLGVGVMATGHGTGRPNNGGLLINTSRMREVTVEADTRIARVAAGALWREVVTAAAAHELAGLPGSSTRVGVVGYTLGGGFGWLGRRYGFAAQSVLRATVVTAEGDVITASPDEHPDLFWALKGGTGNLGIVTSMEFRLHPVSRVYAGNLYYPLDRARELLEFFAQWSRSAPPELTSATTFRTFPPSGAIPEALRGRTLVALRGCYCGDAAEGRALIDTARSVLGPAAVDTFADMSAADLGSLSMDPVDRCRSRTTWNCSRTSVPTPSRRWWRSQAPSLSLLW